MVSRVGTMQYVSELSMQQIFRYRANPGWFLARFCLLLPMLLFTVLICGLTLLGFSFSTSKEREVAPEDVEKYPFQYFSEIHVSYPTFQ